MDNVEKKDYIWQKKSIVTYTLSIFVFWIHCSSFAHYTDVPVFAERIYVGLYKGVCLVGVPLFFIISGALFYRNYSQEKYLIKLKKRISTLIIPYFMWNIINMLFYMVTSELFSQYFIGRSKFEYTWSNIFNAVFHYSCNFPFWFVFTLIVFVIAAPIIDLIVSNKYIGTVIIIVLALLCDRGIGLPSPLFYSQTSVVYYLVGAVIGKHFGEVFLYEVKSGKVIWISACLALVSWTYEILVHYERIPYHIITEIVVLIVFSISVWNVFDFVCRHVKVREFMNHSFWVYALHQNVSAIITKLFWLLFPKSGIFALPNFIVTTIGTLALIELICVIVKKMSPKLYNILSGER